MPIRRQIFNYNGKTIIFLDHSNLEGRAYIAAIESSYENAKNSTLGSRLVLIDAANSVVDKNVLHALKKLSSAASSKLSKTAILGVSGIQKMFIKTVAHFSKTAVRAFPNKETALQWLTDDSSD